MTTRTVTKETALRALDGLFRRIGALDPIDVMNLGNVQTFIDQAETVLNERDAVSAALRRLYNDFMAGRDVLDALTAARDALRAQERP